MRLAQAWMGERSRREQILIAGFGGFLIVLLFWFVLLRPLLEARAEALSRIDISETVMARIRNAGPIAAAGPALPPGPIETGLTTQATAMGVAGARVSRDGRDLLVAVSDAPFASVAPWIASLEGDEAVSVVSARLIRKDAGIVDAEVRVRPL